ncbi:Protein STIP1-like protein [Hordeum vulgare]|nr:Protein STIP1-like protein [Hordeum vulgare]
MDGEDDKSTKDELKLCGDIAVKRKNYRGASAFYSEAIRLDPSDATLYSNRSLCYLQMTEADKAVRDANTCIKLRPEWIKGYYREGAALMSLEDYKEACDAFMAGLQRTLETPRWRKC